VAYFRFESETGQTRAPVKLQIIATPVWCQPIGLAISQVKVLPKLMDPQDFKFVDNLRPTCSKCGRPLILTRIEPEKPGYDLRTYYCTASEDVEVIVAAI
jgi:hypothetical protein